MIEERTNISDSRFLMRVGAVLVATSLVIFAWLDTWAFGASGALNSIPSASELFSTRQLGFRLVWLGFFCWALAHLNHHPYQEHRHGMRWRLVGILAIALALGSGRLGSGAPPQAVISTVLLVCGVWTVSKTVKVSDNHHTALPSQRFVTSCLLIFSLILDLLIVSHDAHSEEIGLPVEGGESQVALAMFRLARMASVAVPLFLLMHNDISRSADDKPILIKWVPKIFLFGAVALPLLLILPPMVWMPLKYAMPLGSDAVLIGVGFTAFWAFRKRLKVEFIGWLLLALSMNMGLLMGAYAFDGPFSPPEFVGEFLDSGRRLLRSIHVEVIVTATALIVADRWRRASGVFSLQEVQGRDHKRVG